MTVPGAEIEGSAQLEDVYVYECHVVRTVVEDGTPAVEQTFDPRIAGYEVSEDGRNLVVILEGTVRYQYRPEAYATIRCAVIGEFRLRRDYSDEEGAAFAHGNGQILLWPYLRTYIAEYAATMQVPFPPIPVLDVSSVVEAARRAAAKRESATRATTSSAAKAKTRARPAKTPKKKPAVAADVASRT